MRRVAVLGSTGSIGRQALDVLSADPTWQIVALSGGRNAGLLAAQAARHRPELVILGDDGDPGPLGDLPPGTRLERGQAALATLAARSDLDLVLVGTGGMVSLEPVLAALAAGTPVATANKETLVAGGHLVMPLARTRAAERRAHVHAGASPGGTTFDDGLADPLGWIRPIDSEHSAIWQCLAGEDRSGLSGIILTASGGPFLDLDRTAMARITPEAALRHPTWSMGAKITIDSATLANKGLEVIEAYWLYDVPYGAIDVVIHPQSVVHSAVRFVDGSLKAQLGTPDMRLPIQYALTYPLRRPSPARAPDLVEIGRLDFRAPDLERFPALAIAREAGRQGPWASAALIAADEVAVARFLDRSLDFAGIPRLLEAAVTAYASTPGAPSATDLVELEAEVGARYAPGAWA